MSMDGWRKRREGREQGRPVGRLEITGRVSTEGGAGSKTKQSVCVKSNGDVQDTSGERAGDPKLGADIEERIQQRSKKLRK